MLTVAPRDAGADPLIADLRAREFARLDAQDLAYLDYGGAALYADRQVREHVAQLRRGVFGNPHSENDPSRASTAALDAARTAVLSFLDADPADYTVVFTANSSSAIKLVAESYPFATESRCVLSADNHNSVNGIREYAWRAGADVRYLPLDADLRLRRDPLPAAPIGAPSLFAFPAQSNFSGVKHPLSWIDDAQRAGYDVLLDAAAYVPTNTLSLRVRAPSFVALSFYKVFGYPTGVGALVARRDALARLRRPWFAGGTVDYASTQTATHQLRASAEAFEDGTPDFLNIGGLAPGFALMSDVGVARIAAHTARLAAHLVGALRDLTHGDDSPLTRVYGPASMDDRGATVAFNVLDRAGFPLPYAVVEDRARRCRVALRGGCFCNPGASEFAFGFDASTVTTCFRTASEEGFTIPRFAACMGRGVAVGAVRASLGLANNDRDVRRAIDVVASFR